MDNTSSQGTASNLFGFGDELKKLHTIALVSKTKLEQTFEDDWLAVAILDHNETPESCTPVNFHWFKLRPVSFPNIFHSSLLQLLISARNIQ